MARSDQRGGGYGTAVVGTLIGAWGGVAAAYFAVKLWMQLTGPEHLHGGEVLLLVPLAAAAVLLGSITGCGLALRARGRRGAGRTARLLGPLMVVGVAASVLLFLSPLNAIAPAVMYFLILVVVPASVAVWARHLALRG